MAVAVATGWLDQLAAVRGADQAIAEAIDAPVEGQQADTEDRDDGAAGLSAPAGELQVNCTAGPVGDCGLEGAADAQRRELRLYRGAGDGNPHDQLGKLRGTAAEPV